ncbi:hypothetical protein ACLOJK_008781 [Asimina triloba]
MVEPKVASVTFVPYPELVIDEHGGVEKIGIRDWDVLWIGEATGDRGEDQRSELSSIKRLFGFSSLHGFFEGMTHLQNLLLPLSRPSHRPSTIVVRHPVAASHTTHASRRATTSL